MADLITLAEFKTALGLTDATDDPKITAALKRASAAIRTYTERSFASESAPATRTYTYDGSGWLSIEDASAVTAVVLDGSALVADLDYVLGPDRGYLVPDAALIFEWIELPRYSGGSPEMGFMQNLDTLWFKRRPFYKVDVTGTFGWPEVPEDVKQAAVWTVENFIAAPQPYSQAAIDSYSYTIDDMRQAIPSRAKDLLNSYRRMPY